LITYVRNEEGAINQISAGFLTGGILAFRGNYFKSKEFSWWKNRLS
jgi:hypothetical protein